MTPVPLELPLRAGDAAQLADAIFDSAQDRPLTEAIRNRITARIASLKLESIRPWPGSLAPDPIHPAAYFIAVDAFAQAVSQPVLLRIASSSTPASASYPKSLLIGRMRAGLGPEVVVNAIPFGPDEYDRLRLYVTEIDGAFAPRPLGTRPPFAVAARRPDLVLPGAFTAFRYLLRNRGVNWAAIASVESSRLTESAALWAAIRAGWREGFTLETTAVIPESRGYTTFIAAPGLETGIAKVKAGAGPWKRFDPDPAIESRTARLSAILDSTPPEAIADAILEFALD